MGESVPKACPPGWMEEAQGPQKELDQQTQSFLIEPRPQEA